MSCKPQRGANLVEAALVLPILLLLWIGIIEFGRGYQIYQTITNAAREGARLSVAPPPGGGSALISATEVKNAVCAQLSAGGIACNNGTDGIADVSVCQACPSGPQPAECTATCNPDYTPTFNGANTSYTQVDVSVQYHFVFSRLSGPLTIKTQAVMRNENN